MSAHSDAQLSDLLTAWWNGDAGEPKSYHVYILFSGDEPVYIGRTEHLQLRLRKHRADPAKDCVTRIEAVSCNTEQELDDLERELIDIYTPRLNRKGLPGTYLCWKTRANGVQIHAMP